MNIYKFETKDGRVFFSGKTGKGKAVLTEERFRKPITHNDHIALMESLDCEAAASIYVEPLTMEIRQQFIGRTTHEAGRYLLVRQATLSREIGDLEEKAKELERQLGYVERDISSLVNYEKACCKASDVDFGDLTIEIK